MDRERDRRSRPDSALGPREAGPRRPRVWAPPRSLRATRAGWCFIAIIFGVGFGALNTGNNLLYLVLALMLAFLVLSGLLSEASLRGIRVERRLPRELFAHGDNRVVLRVRNQQSRVASFAISLEDVLDADAERPRADSAGRCFALRIGPGEHADRSYVFRPARRGEIAFDRVRVSTRFPFGLFVKSAELAAYETALVYPAVHATALREDDRSTGREAEELRGRVDRGDDVTGLREHQAGDSMRRVHWRRSLRAGRLLVGEREGDASGELEVELQLPAGAGERLQEDRIAEAASEIVTHLEAGLCVGLQSPHVRIPANRGASHRTELLTYLARVDGKRLARETPRPDSAS